MNQIEAKDEACLIKFSRFTFCIPLSPDPKKNGILKPKCPGITGTVCRLLHLDPIPLKYGPRPTRSSDDHAGNHHDIHTVALGRPEAELRGSDDWPYRVSQNRAGIPKPGRLGPSTLLLALLSYQTVRPTPPAPSPSCPRPPPSCVLDTQKARLAACSCVSDCTRASAASMSLVSPSITSPGTNLSPVKDSGAALQFSRVLKILLFCSRRARSVEPI